MMTRKRKYAEKKVNLIDDPTKIMEVLDQESQKDPTLDVPVPGLMLVTSNELNELGVSNDDGQAADFQNDNTLDLQGKDQDQTPPQPPDRVEHNDADDFLNDLIDLNAIHSDPESIEFLSDDCPPPAKVQRLDVRGRGKPLDPVWNEYHSDPNPNNKNTKVKCQHCGKAISNKVQRLKTHLEKCSKYKASVSRRKSVPEPPSSRLPLKVKEKADKRANQNESEKLPPIKLNTGVQKQGTMTSFLDRMTSQEQEELKMEIGRYVYSMNLPFTHVEHPAFIRMFRTLRPACTIPSRKTIGVSVLNKTYKKVMNEQTAQIKGKMVTILQDGWKTRISEPVVAHSLIAGGKPYFLNAVSTEEHTKTSKYCAELLTNAIKEVTEMGGNVIAVVTDNCSSMEKMRRLVQESFPGIYAYGCHAHLLNLVGKKCTPDDTMEKVQKVHNYFRNHEAAWAVLKRKKVGRPILPSTIRWNSWQQTFEYYVKTHAKFLEVSRNPSAKVVDEEILSIIADNQFFSEVERALVYMKPIQVALDVAQRENSTIADGVNEWIKLRDTLTFHDQRTEDYFAKQFNRAVQPVGIAAHMLHPKYRGEGLDSSLIDAGNQFLSLENPFLVVIAAQLKNRNAQYFPPSMFADKVITKCNSVDWWSSQNTFGKISSDVVEFAVKLNQLPAGSAEIERHFSTLGNIINIRRTRLGIDKASKLCVIYKHFATEEPPVDDGGDWDISDDESSSN